MPPSRVPTITLSSQHPAVQRAKSERKRKRSFIGVLLAAKAVRLLRGQGRADPSKILCSVAGRLKSGHELGAGVGFDEGRCSGSIASAAGEQGTEAAAFDIEGGRGEASRVLGEGVGGLVQTLALKVPEGVVEEGHFRVVRGRRCASFVGGAERVPSLGAG